MQYTAIIKNENGWWIGWIEEISGINCQERTKEDLIVSLKVTLKEALEFNKQESKIMAGEFYIEEIIAI